MAEQHANVSSIEAIDVLRSGIINYLAKSRPLVEDSVDDVHRTRQWLQHDRRLYWENQVKRRRKVLEEAEQAVFSARIANLREVSSAENAAVLRAKRALTEAEDKLRIIKKWTLDFDNRVEPLVKQLEQLRTMLGNTMPKAAAHLANILKALDAYANTNLAANISTPAPSSDAAAQSSEPHATPQPASDAAPAPSSPSTP